MRDQVEGLNTQQRNAAAAAHAPMVRLLTVGAQAAQRIGHTGAWGLARSARAEARADAAALGRARGVPVRHMTHPQPVTRARDGECEKNPGSMLSLCPQACGTCQELENFKKDEL